MLQLTTTTLDSIQPQRVIENPLLGVFITFLIFVVLGVGVLFIIRKVLHKRNHARHGKFAKVVLRVLLPKESTATDRTGKGDERLEELREQIGVAEAFFAALGGLHAEKGMKAWFVGRQDHFAFEIVAQRGLIHFYVEVPYHLQQFIEQQLHAQYPDAHIEEVADYNIFSIRGGVAGTMLTLKNFSALPIKTYRKLDSDPLNAITNSLSKVPEGDGAAIQYIIRSARSGWRKRGVRLASLMQQGKKFDEAKRQTTSWGKFADVLPWNKSKKDADTPQPEQYKLSPLEEEMVRGIEEKAGKLGLDMNIRLLASAETQAAAEHTLRGIVGAFAQYNAPQYGNSFVKKSVGTKHLVRDFIFRTFDEKHACTLNTEEFASVFHFPLPSTETPNINWLSSRKATPPANLPSEGLLLGHVSYRGVNQEVRIKKDDRRRHAYIIGRSGSGKSVLLENMILQDIRNGEGVCVVDPHGDLVDDVLKQYPKERADDLVVFAPADVARPMGLNMLEAQTEDQRDFATQEMISIFYKLVSDPQMIGPMFEHYMRNAMLTLMSDPANPGTIVEIPRILTDEKFQKLKLKTVTDPIIRAFWEKELPQTATQTKGEMLPYLVSKIGRFIENSMVRNIIGQQQSSFDFRKIMDEKKVLLVDLSKGKVGEMNAKLLGLIIVTKLQMAALSRANLPEEERNDFYLYIDEFQNFVTDSIATILSEARKYRLDLVMAHQYMAQLAEGQNTTVRDAVLGNAGTMLSFRIGIEDAETLEKEFKPTFSAHDLVNVEQYTAYIKLLIDNTASKPFNMKTYPPGAGDPKLAEALRQLSRLKYGRPKEIVEAEIVERSQLA
jgi:hypothetical protein